MWSINRAWWMIEVGSEQQYLKTANISFYSVKRDQTFQKRVYRFDELPGRDKTSV